MSLAASQMMAGGEVDGEGSARRRRQRRLRSWLKHERQSVAMALAEYTHHASRGQTRARAREEVENVARVGLRAQKSPPPGERPGCLVDPGPQRSDRTVRRSAGDGLPTPGLPVLAGASGEAVDAFTLSFLTAKALEDTRKEEVARKEAQKEAKRRKKQDAVDAAMVEFRTLLLLPKERETPETQRRLDELHQLLYSPSSSSGARRKRKKRRKRRTPRTSSLPGRARRRLRQRHFPVSLFDLWSMSLLCGTCSFHRCNDEICADNYFYFRFKLKGKGLCEQWEVFLYGDKIIKVDCDTSVVLPRGVPPSGIGGVGFGSSPFLVMKHTIYELCLPSERVCVAMSCGGGFSPDGAYGSMGQRDADDWKYTFDYFQYQRDVGCVCMLNHWFSSIDEVCADNYFFPVQVDGKCRNEKWELYLYGDLSFKVDRVSVEVLPRGVPPLWFFTLLGNGSHYLRVVPTFRAWPGDEHAFGSSSLEWEVLRDVRVHSSFCGPPAMSFTVSLAGCTIAATAAAVSTSSASADCTGSATPMCSSGAYAAMSCDGGSLTPVGAVHGLTG